MKVAFLGTGVWGYCLARLLRAKGYQTVSWSRDQQLVDKLNKHEDHPFLEGFPPLPGMQFTSDILSAIKDADLIVESVTSAGLRPVFETIKSTQTLRCPIVITSKGIEQNTGLILSEILIQIFGKGIKNKITCLSGPSYAQEVIRELPTSVVVSGYDAETTMMVCDAFSTPNFRIYPNEDIHGVAYGGALKNIIAIACGISEGLGLGNSTKAAIMTRGLHEIRKVAVAKGCKPETIYGLSGMGDLCLTCSSLMSRNCRFGYLLAKGYSTDKALKEIGMVVEGLYTCVSALQLSKQLDIPMPITQMVYKIAHEGMPIQKAVQMLMERTVKAEHL